MRLPLSIALAALLCGVTAVSAAEAGGPADASFALKPLKYDPALTATKSYFILSSRSGDAIKDRIRVVNTGGTTGTAYLYPVDATTGQTSGAVYLSRQAPRHDVGAWIALSRSRVTLAPGRSAVVDFTVRVPRAARPGDHLGGIVAENALVQSSRGGGALQIRVRHLTIAAVEVQLPGRAVGRVVATGVKPGGEHGYQYVYLHLKSTGTVMIKPIVTLTVKDAAGRIVARRTLQLDTFIPGTEIDYPALLPKQALGPGTYTASVRLRSSANTVLGYRKTPVAPFDSARSFPFTISSGEQTKVFSGAAPVRRAERTTKAAGSKRSYLLLGVVVVLSLLLMVVLAVLLVLLRRARRRRGGPASAKPKSPAPEASPTAADVEDELPGWAGLLAAYETRPRGSPNSWPEHDEHHGAVVAVPVEEEPPFELPLEPSLEQEPQPAPEPEPAASIPDARATAPVRADVVNLSSALAEASLIALAAVLATRLLRRAD